VSKRRNAVPPLDPLLSAWIPTIIAAQNADSENDRIEARRRAAYFDAVYCSDVRKLVAELDAELEANAPELAALLKANDRRRRKRRR
jgi:hypothetical protein